MRNSSHRPGCIRALPASQSCHVRRVEWMRSAAEVCESPADSRAARTSSGVGFRAALPARLRLGWLATDCDKYSIKRTAICALHISGYIAKFSAQRNVIKFWEIVGITQNIPVLCIGWGVIELVCEFSSEVCSGFDCVHFVSPSSPDPEARCKRSVYDSKYTRIPCKCKRFLKIFPRAQRAVDYRIGLIARIGLSELEAIESDNAPWKYSIDDLKRIKAVYKQKLKCLKGGDE